ncbi:MAG: polysaccharide deacetylase family protein [Spirochaetales bacterium]|nr:polysaccharide deacetylase family protein [Spirochaetales bacterium]
MKRLNSLIFIFLISISSASAQIILSSGDLSSLYLNSTEGRFGVAESGREWGGSLFLETEGKGTNVQLATRETGPFSLEGRRIDLELKVSGLDNLNEFWIFAASDSLFENRIVYRISDDRTQLMEGHWIDLSLPLSAGKIWGSPDLTDMKYFQIWINDRGSGPVRLEMSPLFASPQDRDGAAVITFDDGWESQYTRAAPVLKELGLTATAYVIPEKIGTPFYMTAEQMNSLEKDFGWSLGSHYRERLEDKTAEELNAIFRDHAAFFKEHGIEKPDFSYPNGKVSPALLETVPLFFSSGRTIVEYSETEPPGDPYRLRTVNIYPGFDRETLTKRLQNAYRNGELVIFIFHKIEEYSQFETELSIEEFREICNLILKSGIAVKTMSELSSGWKDMDVTIPEPVILGDLKELKPAAPSDMAGMPVKTDGIHIDFGLDWKMVLGTRVKDSAETSSADDEGAAGDFQFYSQLEDLYFYIQSPLWEGSQVYGALGFHEVNFADITAGTIDGSVFSLKHIYMEQMIGDFLSLDAGYYVPDPLNKWLQVTRSAGIEPSLGQEMAPRTLWLQGKADFNGLWGLQVAFSPDIIGKYDIAVDDRILTYHEQTADNDAPGVPNLFGSLWFKGDALTAETAAALNGDAFKIAAAFQYDLELTKSALHFSAGVKFLDGGTFKTYPLWDHSNSLRLSAGVSWTAPAGPFFLSPGAAYQFRYMTGDSTTLHQMGLDLGLSWRNLEIYTVFSFYNVADLLWQENAGFESGLIFHFKGVDYMAGYTMSGFNALSGLYNNKDWNEGGVNGFFLRIKATYW